MTSPDLTTLGTTVKDGEPVPPKAALDLLANLHRHDWTHRLWQTHGAGTHPTHGYVQAAFARVTGVKGDVRVEVEWIIQRASVYIPGWKPAHTVGRWARQGYPVVTLRGECDPGRFTTALYLDSKKDQVAPSCYLAAVTAVTYLVESGDPLQALRDMRAVS